MRTIGERRGVSRVRFPVRIVVLLALMGTGMGFARSTAAETRTTNTSPRTAQGVIGQRSTAITVRVARTIEMSWSGDERGDVTVRASGGYTRTLSKVFIGASHSGSETATVTEYIIALNY